jgi:hypothetical protein
MYKSIWGLFGMLPIIKKEEDEHVAAGRQEKITSPLVSSQTLEVAN